MFTAFNSTQDCVIENLESQTITQDTESGTCANSDDLPQFLTQIASGNNKDICYYSSTSNHLIQNQSYTNSIFLHYS